MKWVWIGSRLTVFARTFLLVLVALAVAEVLGFALFAPRERGFGGPPPPPHESHFETGPGPGPGDPGEGPAGAGPSPGGGPGPGADLLRSPSARELRLFALSLLILLPLSALFAAVLSAPVRRFAEGASRMGRDSTAPALVREGPAEMIVAADSFNAMQARLNRMLRERTHMIAAIAHDLRTPLMRLSFRLEDLPSPLHEKVEADIQEMKSMISAALEFFRDRAQEAPREPLDFRLLVESVVDDLTDTGQAVSLAAGPAVTLTGDPLALRRMVGNLVDNALKYGARARVSLRTDASACVLEVDDDGPGIPSSLQDMVFDPFFRGEGSRNRSTGGIGLGLTTVRSIVLDHGGEISLRNRPEGGLRVTVKLPSK